MTKYRTRALLLTIPMVLLLSSCVTIDILNLSELRARVMILTPDSASGTTRVIKPGDSTSTFSNHGGRYTITLLPDLEYKKLLEELQAEISRRLFEERDSLSAEDVALLVNRLNDVDSNLQQLAKEGASCSGNAPDFSSVTAVLTWSNAEQNWALDCGVSESDVAQ
jgi:hypothetical protein